MGYRDLKKVNVVGAILINENKILCAQRGQGEYEYISHKYEFPGGKIDPGETPKEALSRELKEEMLLDIPENKLEYFDVVNHKYQDFEITMELYKCYMDNRNVTLTEHVNVEWLSVEEMDKLDWAAADIPIVKELKARGI